LEEAENAVSALVSCVDAQGVSALAYFLGLRAAVKGVVGETKTPESVASLPLIASVRVPFELWRKKLL
jgi:hypothetical protein